MLNKCIGLSEILADIRIFAWFLGEGEETFTCWDGRGNQASSLAI